MHTHIHTHSGTYLGTVPSSALKRLWSLNKPLRWLCYSGSVAFESRELWTMELGLDHRDEGHTLHKTGRSRWSTGGIWTSGLASCRSSRGICKSCLRNTSSSPLISPYCKAWWQNPAGSPWLPWRGSESWWENVAVWNAIWKWLSLSFQRWW